MKGRRNEVGWWYFNTVEEFWDAEGLEEQVVWVERNDFSGWLAKGIVGDGAPRNARLEDKRRGRLYNAIFVKQLSNPCRLRNWEYSSDPPPRTGKFDEFMDEVESVAIRFGLTCVFVKDVANEFLPAKLERRGYNRVDHLPHPDFVKVMMNFTSMT